MADVSRLPGPNADFWDWQMKAACRGLDSEMFFHPEGERGSAKEAREKAAKALCATCPVLQQCRVHIEWWQLWIYIFFQVVLNEQRFQAFFNHAHNLFYAHPVTFQLQLTKSQFGHIQ